MPDTPFDYLHSAAHDALLYDDGRARMTYERGRSMAAGAASLLRDAGVLPGQRVALDVPAPLHVVMTLAVMHEGAISLHALPGSTLAVDWLITTDPGRRGPRTLIADRAFLHQALARTDQISPQPMAPDDTCRLVFSSGTTGTPKAVAFTVRMIEGRCDDAGRFWLHTRPFLCTLDAATVSGFQTLWWSLRAGACYFIPGDGPTNVAHILRGHVRSIKASPAQLTEIIRAWPADTPAHALELIQVAGAMLPAHLAHAANRATGARIVNLYGCTETGNVSIRDEGYDPYDAGVITPGTTVEAVDEDGAVCSPGAEGRLRWMRPLQAKEYVDDPVASAAAFEDGWFYPGDLGSVSPEGRITLAGRDGEIINAGGVKVDPQRIDAAASAIAGVADAAGFAASRADGLEDIALAVVPTDGFDATALTEALHEALGSACPRVIVEVERIPRNGIGKALRAQLAAECAARLPNR